MQLREQSTTSALSLQSPQRSIIRPVSQVVLKLHPDGERSVLDESRDIILRWMSRRAGPPLPQDAWSGDSFTLDDIGAQHTEAISIHTPRYWAARLDDGDRTVAQRVWSTEIALGENKDGSVVFGSRLQCVTRGTDAPFDPSIPSFVRDVVAERRALLDGREVSAEPWVIRSDADVNDLVDFLVDPSRKCNVYVFSLPEQSSNINEVAASASEVAKYTVGTAHVAIITGPASFALSDLVGKEFSVFLQAVRTYRPGFNTETDDVFRHPLALPHRVFNWGNVGASAFEKMLIAEALRQSISGRDVEHRFPPFSEVRRVASELQRQAEREAGSSDAELLALAEEEIERLNGELNSERKDSESLIELVEADRAQAIEDAQRVRSQNMYLRQRIESLEDQLVGSGGDVKPSIPTSLDDFESWCHENLAGSVDVHNRALQGAKKSKYEDSTLIYRALLLLRDYYVPMRREGGEERWRRFQEACQELGVSEDASITASRSGEQGDSYYIRYGGKRRLMDRHLKKGTSREERRCFRPYFFYDDEDQEVVVGWLPSHLDTRIT